MKMPASITMKRPPDYGALVISLDFELFWGVSDFLNSNPGYRSNLLGEREAIPAILAIFEEFGIASTWATVGFLFAESGKEAQKFRPKLMPEYLNPTLNPYNELDRNDEDSAIRYAPELIRLIKNTPKQEIATHTFSHYYCLEKGQTKQGFEADIQSAVAIAEAQGIAFKSIVFPRNQHNADYDDVLLQNGIICYRGNQESWMYQFNAEVQVNPIHRMARLADTYLNVSGANAYRWDDVRRGKMANVRASMFLRPVSGSGILSRLQFRRVAKSLESAAKNKQIFHLWWHPHNFGVNLPENITFLKQILETFAVFRDRYGMQSLSMSQVGETV
jgi:hypothetical protein